MTKSFFMSIWAKNIFFVKYRLLEHISMRERGKKNGNFQFYLLHIRIFAKTIFGLFHIVANLKDFHPLKASVGKEHIPN